MCTPHRNGVDGALTAGLADSRLGPHRTLPVRKGGIDPGRHRCPGHGTTGDARLRRSRSSSCHPRGRSDVTAGSLVAYGAVSAVVSIIIWRYVGQVDRTSDLLVAEARQWGASAAFSALVAVGAVVAMILGRTDFSDADRYVDSVLVLLGCAMLVPQPYALLRTALIELLEGAPGENVQARVHDAIAVVRDEFGLDEPTLTMSKVGRKLYVEATFMVAPHSWDIDGEDAVRRSFATSLADLPYEPWLNIELTTDPAQML